MLKDLGRSLLGRLLSLGVFILGFWLLYQGLLRDDNIVLLVLGVGVGSLLILGGLYLMATTRRIAARQSAASDSDSDSDNDSDNEIDLDGEAEPGDSCDDSRPGSGQSD